MEINRTETKNNTNPLPPFAKTVAKNVAIAIAASTCAVGINIQPVNAEGSRNLYPATATGFRANLEWRTSNISSNLWGGILQRRTLLKVYAQAGEYILLGSSAVDVLGTNGQKGDILVYNPGLVTGSIGSETIPTTPSFSCLNQRTSTGNPNQGKITSRAQELAGPDTIINPATATPGNIVINGYVPCFYQAPITGIYDIVIYGPNGFNTNANPGPGDVTGSIPDHLNNFNSNQLSTVSSWDVTVRNSLTSTTDINGRLFTYALSLFTGNNGRPVNSTVYVVTTDGYRYQTDFRGIDPNGFMVYGNLEGFLDSDGVTPLYHDVRGNDALLSSLDGGVSLARPKFPIFFSDLKNPSIAVEAEKVLIALGIPTAPTTPTVSTPNFVGTAGSGSSYVNTGGTFNFNSNISGTYELIIKGSGSTDFDPANPLNRVLRGIMSAPGPQSVTWDGKDNSGNFFPIGSNYQTRVTVRAGEYHFPLLDVENSTQGGPSITLINPPAAHPLGNSVAFFNDRNYVTKNGTPITIQGCGINPPPGAPGFPGRSDPINGFDSVVNSSYRQFGTATGGNTNTPCTGSFGDVKGLDLWTYFPSVSQTGTFNVVPPPDLTITKTHTGNFTVGQNGTYTITVTNAATAGPTTGTITVVDTLPTGLTFVSASGTGWTCNAVGQTVTCTNPGPLPAGGSSQLILTVNATAAGSGNNTANVSTPGETNTGNNTATDPTVINPPPDLTITKTHTGNFTVGQNGTYTITVTNAATAGPTTGTITVVDTLPTGLTFVSASGTGWTCNAVGQTVTCTNPGPLAPGASSVINLTVNPTTPGEVSNSANVATPGESDTNNNSSTVTNTVTLPSADLSIVKTTNQTSVTPGGTISYTITVSNAGPSNVTGATVIDNFPSGITDVTWNCAITEGNGSCGATSGTGNINTTVNLDSGATATYTVSGYVASNATGNLNNTASVQLPNGFTDPTPDNNSSTVTNTVTLPSADLSIVKTTNQTSVTPGGTISYTITVSNAGPSNVTGATVIDNFPSGITDVTWNCAITEGNGSCGATSGTGNINTTVNLDSGATATYTVSGYVASNATGNLNNTASVQLPNGFTDPTPDNNSSTVTIPISISQADLAIAKTVNNPNPLPGSDIIYTISITNNGPDTATGVQVIDGLPPGLIFVSATPSVGTYNSTTGLWNVGSLNNGASATLQITAKVNTTNSVTNSAAIAASNLPDPNPNNNNASVTLSQQVADLSVNKTVDNPNPTVGQNIQYTITLTNNGPSAATGISLTDQLPLGLTFISATTSQGTYNSGTGVWNVGNLANGATATLTITAKVNTANPTTNTAQITAVDQTDPNPANNSNSVTIPQASADLSVQKTVDNPNPNFGQIINYTVTLTNLGTGDATDVEVKDKLPDGLIFLEAIPSQGTYDSTTGIWSVGNIANQVTATLTIKARVNTANAITNTAQVTASDQSDPNPNNNSSSLTIPQQGADLSVSKTADNFNPPPGTNVTYTITLTNSGPALATNIKIKEQLPPGLTFVSATAETGTYESSTGVWTVPSLAPGASTRLQITATVNTGERFTNSAQITAVDQADPEPTNNQASLTLPSGGADLSLNKTVNNSNPSPGQNITYTLTLTNNGPENATGIQVTDKLPSGLTFVSATPSVGTYNPTTGIWTVPSLAQGASATLQITATVNAVPVTNTASITAADQPDPDSTPGNNNESEDDQSSVTIGPEKADLLVTKTVNNANPNVGQTITYTINVKNNGPAGATNVQVTDPLPSGLSFISATPSVGSYNSSTGIWNVGAIAVNGTATLTVQAKLNTTGVVINTAKVTADQKDTNPENNQASVAVPQKPNLRLVKRLTRVNSTIFTEVINDPNDTNDDAANWPSNYLQGRIDGGSIKPGDEVEYTIYFLSDGGAAAANVTVCDLVPANLGFLANAFGSGRGIAVFLNGSQLAYTNADDADGGQFYPAGTLVPQSCKGSNTNGAVVVNLGTIPSAVGSTSTNSYGFVRFRARLRE